MKGQFDDRHSHRVSLSQGASSNLSYRNLFDSKKIPCTRARTTNFEFKNRNFSSKDQKEFDSVCSDWTRGVNNDWSDILKSGSGSSHFSHASSSSGSELKYSSFVDDVLSQSSEKGSLHDGQRPSKINMSALKRKSVDFIDRNRAKLISSRKENLPSCTVFSNKNRVSFENPVAQNVKPAFMSEKLRKLDQRDPHRLASAARTADWNSLQRRVYCDYIDYENHRWKLSNKIRKGIVNLDKNQMGQLEEENDKLRKKISEFQRENIKLKEDFNELKIYNDKAQQTIKDLKSCLEDARSERSQMVAEIKKLKEQSQNNAVSSIVNQYMEKGLYEDAEKDHLVERDRSRSPNRFIQQRSKSPVFSRPVTPVRTSSPVRMSEPSYYAPVSRSQTPTPCSFNYEDISPSVMSDGHEIYPHRRTRSYVQKYGSQDLPSSKVDLNDPEIQELLKPKTRLTYDLEMNDQESGPQAKRKLLYSPYMDKDYIPRGSQNGYIDKDSNYEEENLPVKKETSHIKSDVEEEWESMKFMDALDHAVTQTPAQLAQQRFLQELTSTDDDMGRWRSPSKGILKNAKSAQNMSIKENISPSRRSFESRSYSPAVRSPLTYSPGKPAMRSFTPEPSYKPVRSYTSNTAQTRSYSPNNRSRSQSPRNTGQRSYSPGNRSSSPGYRTTTKDSGYSTPTQPARYRTAVTNDNRDYSRPRTPTSSRSYNEKKSGLLSEEERRYADLLIDKYTRQHIIGIPLVSS